MFWILLDISRRVDLLGHMVNSGLLKWYSGKESACQCRRLKRCGFDPYGQEDPVEKEMATCSTILAWRIPWTVEPGGLQSMGSQRVECDWATNHTHTHTHTHAHTRLTLCLTFWGTASSVFQSNCPIYVPTSTVLRLLISPCLPQDLLSVVFIISILVGVKWDISLWLPWLLMTSSIFSRASWQTACCKASPGYLNMWAEAWTPCLCWGKAEVFVGSVVGKSFLERRSSERSDWPWYLLKAWGPLGSPSGRGRKDKHW